MSSLLGNVLAGAGLSLGRAGTRALAASPRLLARSVGSSRASRLPLSAVPGVGGGGGGGGRVFTALTPELAEAASACIADTFSQQSEPFTWLFNLKRHHWFSLVIPFIERAAHGEWGTERGRARGRARSARERANVRDLVGSKRDREAKRKAYPLRSAYRFCAAHRFMLGVA